MELITLAGNYGFPMVITIYFIFKVERVINNNTVALSEFKQICEKWKRQWQAQQKD